MQTRNKPVILFVAEAVTLAHFARIVTLAKALDPSAYEVVVASDPRYTALEASLGCAFRSIRSIPSAEFAQALDQGKPLYSVDLTRYVEDDLALLDRLPGPVLRGAHFGDLLQYGSTAEHERHRTPGGRLIPAGSECSPLN